MNLGERLKIAREAIGYSQSHVAEKVGLKGASAICELETGKREPKFSQLSKLAEIYHKPVEFFFSNEPIAKPVFLWRSHPEDEEQRKQVEAEFLELCEQYHNLEILTGELRPVVLPIMEDKNAEEFSFCDAESLAIRTRKEFSLGDIPADVLRRVLEEKYYVKIFHLSFKGSAISIRKEEIGSAILLNNNKKNKDWRRNYDLAHELFHLLTWNIFRKNSNQSEPSPNEEKLADVFASYLLLPEEAVKEKVKSYSDSQGKISFDSLDNISREFGVSTEALLWRMHYIYNKNELETKKNVDIAKRHKKLRPSENPKNFPNGIVPWLKELCYKEICLFCSSKNICVLVTRKQKNTSWRGNSRMKKFQFLLLDAGPIIGLFELGLWDSFLAKCDVTIGRIVTDEAKYASEAFEDVRIDLESYEQKGILKVIDVESSKAKAFLDKFSQGYKDSIHPGEQEILAFLEGSAEDYLLCSADKAVFWILGLLNKSEQGISLEEILQKIGWSQRNLEWKYTKRFREKYTQTGQTDAIQGKGLK